MNSYSKDTETTKKTFPRWLASGREGNSRNLGISFSRYRCPKCLKMDLWLKHSSGAPWGRHWHASIRVMEIDLDAAAELQRSNCFLTPFRTEVFLGRLFFDSVTLCCNLDTFMTYTEMRFNLCTRLREVCSCCFLTVLPGPAWVLPNYVLQRILLISVHCQITVYE